MCDDRLEVVSRFVPVKRWCRRSIGGACGVVTASGRPAMAFEVRAAGEDVRDSCGQRCGDGGAGVAKTPRHIVRRGWISSRVNTASRRGARPRDPGEYSRSDHRRPRREAGAGGHVAHAEGLPACHDSEFQVTSSRPGHTLVRIVKKDAASESLVAKPEPGYDADVVRFFSGGQWRQFPRLHGPGASRKVPRRGGISART